MITKRIHLATYTHNLKELIGASGLEGKLNIETQRDTDFGVDWAIVKEWNESSRYQRHDAISAFVTIRNKGTAS